MRIARCLSSTAAVFAAFALSLSAGVAAAQTPPLASGPAAIVNDEIITNYDLQQRALLIAMMAGIRPTPENYNQLLQQALRGLIDERLQIQELRRMEKTQKFNIVADDEEVDRQIEGLARDNNLTAEQFKAQLAGAGLNVGTLREQMRAQISWQRMIQGRYASRVRVSDDQVDQALKRAVADASEPQYYVNEIFLDAIRVGGMEEAMGGATQLIAQMQQGAPFPAVARQFSSAATAANGGDMGWISIGELPPEVGAVVAQMPPRSLSNPIPVQGGVYIVYLREKRAGGMTTVVRLKQAAVALGQDAPADEVSAAQAKLQQVIAAQPTCNDIDAKAGAIDGVISSDLGENDINALAPEFRGAVQGLQSGQISQPVRTSVGLHALLVCDMRAASPQAPTREVVENRLLGDQLTMLSRRYLRDLRNSATIEQP